MHAITLKLVHARVTPVFLVATYARREPRDGLRTILDETKSELFIIECRTAPAEGVARLRSREPGHPAVDLTDERVQRLARKYPYGSGVALDTIEPAAACLAKAEQYVTYARGIDLPSSVLKDYACGSPVSSHG